MLKISQVEFVTSVGRIDQLPRNGLPEVAFAGRSNVGKSSLLNTLFNRKKLVLVSSTPGKTRTLNYFIVNQKYHFVDLPGYGYAKVSRSEMESWRKLIEKYFTSSESLKAVVVLIDIRHSLSKLDRELLEWLCHYGIPRVVVGTKADKLSGNQLTKMVKKNKADLAPYNVGELIPFSAVSGKGKSELMKQLALLLNV